MDELERAFRDALKRADTVTVPVAVDLDEITGSRRARPRWLGGLAVAAAVVLVGGVAAWAWLGRAGVGLPAVPAGAPATIVVVDLYSGRENPTVQLDPLVADQLYDALAGLAPTGLELTDLPDPGLGFRGFVVTPPDDTRPVLRVLPGTVVVDPDGTPEILADSSGRVFAAILDSLPIELRDQVAALLVQLRIGNGGEVDLSEIQVTFPDNQVVDFGTLAPGGTSGYHPVGLAYRYALILATAGGTQHRWQPIDFVGETPLAPGRYTYRISVDGDQIDLQFVEDPPAR